MTRLLNSLKTANRKHAEYRRVRNEIEALSDREASDLGISRADAHRIAHLSVYGA